MKHVVTMRAIERDRSVPERELERIALELLIEMERRLREVKQEQAR